MKIIWNIHRTLLDLGVLSVFVLAGANIVHWWTAVAAGTLWLLVR